MCAIAAAGGARGWLFVAKATGARRTLRRVDLEGELDRLYGLPLDEFVRARDEAAKGLRRAGEREAAEAVKALRKPTAGAWALNQAIRRRRRERDALLAAGERLRAAHDALLSGGDAAELREAMQDERALVSGLADCAEAIASETGKSGAALKERVRATLHAAAVDEEARAELASGRFVREREAVGLGPLAAGAQEPRQRAGGQTRQRAGGQTGQRAGGQTRQRAGGQTRERAGARRAGAERDARESRAARERDERVAAGERLLGEAREALDDARSAHARAADAVAAAREAVRVAEGHEREARKALRARERELAARERDLARLRGA